MKVSHFWLSAKGLAWFQFMAVVSGTVFIISLLHPIPWIENKYVALISSGFFLFAVVDWSQWKGYWDEKRVGTSMVYEPYWEKETKYYHIMLKTIAFLLIILPISELILGIKLIPLP